MKFVFLAITVLFFSIPIFAQTQAEVTAPYTFLRKKPSPGGEKIQNLQKGDKIKIESPEEKDGWLFVSVSEGKVKGWVSVNAISKNVEEKEIEPYYTPKAEPTPQPRPTPQVSPSPKPTPASTLKPEPTPAPVPTPEATKTEAVVKLTPTPEPEVIIDDEVLQIDTEEVTLNIRVVDEKNRFVANLAQTDFKIFEDNAVQEITSLTTTEVPTINALLVDNSRSLRSQLSKVIDAGKIIIDTNRQNDESAVIRFVSKDKIEVLQDFTRNKNSLNNALDNLFVEGGQTAIIDAIYMAAEKVEKYQNSQNKEDVKLRSLIVVSDGDDRSSSYIEKDLFDLLRKSNVQIYTIGFINNLSNEPTEKNGKSRQENARSFLTRLAQETGGKVYFPNSIDELTGIATEISGELRTQYTISYIPSNEMRDGSFRAIKVTVNDGKNKEKRTAITRTGRTASPK